MRWKGNGERTERGNERCFPYATDLIHDKEEFGKMVGYKELWTPKCTDKGMRESPALSNVSYKSYLIKKTEIYIKTPQNEFF